MPEVGLEFDIEFVNITRLQKLVVEIKSDDY